MLEGNVDRNEEGNRDARAALDDEFAAWWSLYPRKVARAEARRAFGKARQAASAEQLASGLHRSVNQWRREHRPPDKLPHASTWLNQQRWEDDYALSAVPDVTDEELERRVAARKAARGVA